MIPTALQPAATADPTGCTRGGPCACSADTRPDAPARVRLSDLRRGQTGVICECELSDDDAALLRAMGLCLSARVRLCRAGEPCIVAIQCGRRSPRRVAGDAACRSRSAGAEWSGSRIGLARSLAERILVTIDHDADA